MRAEEYIEDLAARGRRHFTTGEAVAAIRAKHTAVRAQLRRLKQRGTLASPMRSVHVIVPPEHRRLGCLPAEHFIGPLMKELGEPYYIGLLSAAAHHGRSREGDGATRALPDALQVMVPKNRSRVACGQVRIDFMARDALERMPVSTFETPTGALRYATPELTALELVGYPRQAGGIGQVATLLAELAEVMHPDRLIEAAELLPVGWSQRLGYLLETLERADLANALVPFVQEQARSLTPLLRAESVAEAERSSKWKLLVNVDLEPVD
jgi:predicted transcriptional regulator of viral defense system